MRLTKLIAVAVRALCTPAVNLAKYVNKRMKHLGLKGVGTAVLLTTVNNTAAVIEKVCMPVTLCKQLYTLQNKKIKPACPHISALYVGKVKIFGFSTTFLLSFIFPLTICLNRAPLSYGQFTLTTFLSASGVFGLSINRSSHATDTLLFLSSHRLGPNFFFPLACSVKHDPHRESNHTYFALSMNLWTKSSTIHQGPQLHDEPLGFHWLLVKTCFCLLVWVVVISGIPHIRQWRSWLATVLSAPNELCW